MTSYQPGEIVTVTIPNAKVSDRHVQDSHLWLTIRDEPIYIPLRVLGSVKVERVWPAGSGAPQVGDVWIGRSGTRYAVVDAPGAAEPFLMGFVAGNPLRTSAQIAAHDGPLTLAWREGWTAIDIDQAEQPEPGGARFVALLRHVADGVDAGLAAPWSVDSNSVYIAKDWPADNEQHRRDAVDAWLAHFGATVPADTRRASAYRAVIMWRGDELKIWTPVEAPPAVAPEQDPTALDDLAVAATDPAELPEAGDLLLTPDEWQQEMSEIQILDRDGWGGVGGRPWTDPITRAEYIRRRTWCTISGSAIALLAAPELDADGDLIAAEPRDEPGSGLAT